MTTRNDYPLRLREIDTFVLYDWFEGTMYVQAARYLQTKKIEICVDIGAAVGIASYYMLTHLTPKEIICFEPDEENFKLLQDNISSFTSARLINKAIFYGKTTVDVLGTGDNNVLGYMIADIDSEHTRFWRDALRPYPDKHFSCIELESVVSRADLIKIDVEGSEYNIIENSQIVKECPYLLLETHNHGREYIEKYLSEYLPKHTIIYTQGEGIHLGYLLAL